MLIPEQLFDNPETEEKEAEGISAVKAIQLAQQQGQKIFTITQDNYNEAISQINLSSGAMTDIHNAINAGKTVTTHQSNISYYGWNGSGYIILDPTTGTGAYLISGGSNGGIAFALGSAVAALVVASYVALSNPRLLAVSASITSPFLVGLVAPLVAFFVILTGVMLYAHKDDDTVIGCFLGGLLFSLGIALGDYEFKTGSPKEKKAKGRILGLIGSLISGTTGVKSWSECFGL